MPILLDCSNSPAPCSADSSLKQSIETIAKGKGIPAFECLMKTSSSGNPPFSSGTPPFIVKVTDPDCSNKSCEFFGELTGPFREEEEPIFCSLLSTFINEKVDTVKNLLPLLTREETGNDFLRNFLLHLNVPDEKDSHAQQLLMNLVTEPFCVKCITGNEELFKAQNPSLAGNALIRIMLAIGSSSGLEISSVRKIDKPPTTTQSPSSSSLIIDVHNFKSFLKEPMPEIQKLEVLFPSEPIVMFDEAMLNLVCEYLPNLRELHIEQSGIQQDTLDLLSERLPEVRLGIRGARIYRPMLNVEALFFETALHKGVGVVIEEYGSLLGMAQIFENPRFFLRYFFVCYETFSKDQKPKTFESVFGLWVRDDLGVKLIRKLLANEAFLKKFLENSAFVKALTTYSSDGNSPLTQLLRTPGSMDLAAFLLEARPYTLEEQGKFAGNFFTKNSQSSPAEDIMTLSPRTGKQRVALEKIISVMDALPIPSSLPFSDVCSRKKLSSLHIKKNMPSLLRQKLESGQWDALKRSALFWHNLLRIVDGKSVLGSWLKASKELREFLREIFSSFPLEFSPPPPPSKEPINKIQEEWCEWVFNPQELSLALLFQSQDETLIDSIFPALINAIQSNPESFLVLLLTADKEKKAKDFLLQILFDYHQKHPECQMLPQLFSKITRETVSKILKEPPTACSGWMQLMPFFRPLRTLTEQFPEIPLFAMLLDVNIDGILSNIFTEDVFRLKKERSWWVEFLNDERCTQRFNQKICGLREEELFAFLTECNKSLFLSLPLNEPGLEELLLIVLKQIDSKILRERKGLKKMAEWHAKRCQEISKLAEKAQPVSLTTQEVLPAQSAAGESALALPVVGELALALPAVGESALALPTAVQAATEVRVKCRKRIVIYLDARDPNKLRSPEGLEFASRFVQYFNQTCDTLAEILRGEYDPNCVIMTGVADPLEEDPDRILVCVEQEPNYLMYLSFLRVFTGEKSLEDVMGILCFILKNKIVNTVDFRRSLENNPTYTNFFARFPITQHEQLVLSASQLTQFLGESIEFNIKKLTITPPDHPHQSILTHRQAEALLLMFPGLEQLNLHGWHISEQAAHFLAERFAGVNIGTGNSVIVQTLDGHSPYCPEDFYLHSITNIQGQIDEIASQLPKIYRLPALFVDHFLFLHAINPIDNYPFPQGDTVFRRWAMDPIGCGQLTTMLANPIFLKAFVTHPGFIHAFTSVHEERQISMTSSALYGLSQQPGLSALGLILEGIRTYGVNCSALKPFVLHAICLNTSEQGCDCALRCLQSQRDEVPRRIAQKFCEAFGIVDSIFEISPLDELLKLPRGFFDASKKSFERLVQWMQKYSQEWHRIRKHPSFLSQFFERQREDNADNSVLYLWLSRYKLMHPYLLEIFEFLSQDTAQHQVVFDALLCSPQKDQSLLQILFRNPHPDLINALKPILRQFILHRSGDFLVLLLTKSGQFSLLTDLLLYGAKHDPKILGDLFTSDNEKVMAEAITSDKRLPSLMRTTWFFGPLLELVNQLPNYAPFQALMNLHMEALCSCLLKPDCLKTKAQRTKWMEVCRQDVFKAQLQKIKLGDSDTISCFLGNCHQVYNSLLLKEPGLEELLDILLSHPSLVKQLAKSAQFRKMSKWYHERHPSADERASKSSKPKAKQTGILQQPTTGTVASALVVAPALAQQGDPGIKPVVDWALHLSLKHTVSQPVATYVDLINHTIALESTISAPAAPAAPAEAAPALDGRLPVPVSELVYTPNSELTLEQMANLLALLVREDDDKGENTPVPEISPQQISGADLFTINPQNITAPFERLEGFPWSESGKEYLLNSAKLILGVMNGLIKNFTPVDWNTFVKGFQATVLNRRSMLFLLNTLFNYHQTNSVSPGDDVRRFFMWWVSQYDRDFNFFNQLMAANIFPHHPSNNPAYFLRKMLADCNFPPPNIDRTVGALILHQFNQRPLDISSFLIGKSLQPVFGNFFPRVSSDLQSVGQILKQLDKKERLAFFQAAPNFAAFIDTMLRLAGNDFKIFGVGSQVRQPTLDEKKDFDFDVIIFGLELMNNMQGFVAYILQWLSNLASIHPELGTIKFQKCADQATSGATYPWCSVKATFVVNPECAIPLDFRFVGVGGGLRLETILQELMQERIVSDSAPYWDLAENIVLGQLVGNGERIRLLKLPLNLTAANISYALWVVYAQCHKNWALMNNLEGLPIEDPLENVFRLILTPTSQDENSLHEDSFRQCILDTLGRLAQQKKANLPHDVQSRVNADSIVNWFQRQLGLPEKSLVRVSRVMGMLAASSLPGIQFWGPQRDTIHRKRCAIPIEDSPPRSNLPQTSSPSTLSPPFGG